MARAQVPAAAPPATVPAEQAGPAFWSMNDEVTALAPSRPMDPEFLPKGIPLERGGGPFRLFTNLTTSASYDNNVYRLSPNVGIGEKSDFFFTASPTIYLDYETSSLHLDAYGDGAFNQYAKLTSANNIAYDSGLRGAYIISRAAQLTGNVSYSQDVLSLSSPDNLGNQARGTQYNDFNTNLQFKFQPNRLGFKLGYNSDTYRYDRSPLLTGGSVDISYRNNDHYQGFVEGDYDFSPGYEGFVRATYNATNYQQFLVLGERRTTTGEQYDAGLKFLLTDLIQGQLYLGYLSEFYDKHQAVPLHDISGLDFGATVTWFPTELLTVHLAGQRSVVDTIIVGASGGDDRNVSLSADYELTRQIYFGVNASYDTVAYRGAFANDLVTLGFGSTLKWLVSHYAQADLSFEHSSRNPVVPNFAYHDDLVTLGLNFQI